MRYHASVECVDYDFHTQFYSSSTLFVSVNAVVSRNSNWAREAETAKACN